MENGFHKKARWETRASEASLRTINPIRGIVDGMKLEPNPDKDIIALSIGKLLSERRLNENYYLKGLKKSSVPIQVGNSTFFFNNLHTIVHVLLNFLNYKL